MSSFCSASSQSCVDGCCDRYGYCPSTLNNPCYYYYSRTTASTSMPLTIGGIIGIVMGVVIVVGVIVFIIWYKKRQQMMMAIANGTDPLNAQSTNNQTTIFIPGQGMAQPVSVYPGGQMGTPTPFGPGPAYNNQPQPYQATPFPGYNPQPQTVYNPYNAAQISPIGQGSTPW